MTRKNRVFILGAGFSKPAGMPLATELLPLLTKKLELAEMQGWLDGMRERLAWLDGSRRYTSCCSRLLRWLKLDWATGGNSQTDSFKLNIEQVFHYAHFDVEVHRIKQHLAPVGPHDGSGTPWNVSESISAWLSYLEDALRDVIFEKDEQAELAPIRRWAETIDSGDSVVTFNYDTLVERALSEVSKNWNHGTCQEGDAGIPVFKLHGSIDWIVAHRSECFSQLQLLFDKENANRLGQNTGHVEDDCRLWRCRTREQLRKWIAGCDLQSIPENASPRTVGIAGLGAYKQLHQVPGLGQVWTQGRRALYKADRAVVVGFSMSDFDAMAQMQFAEVARRRKEEGRPLAVTVIDPFGNEATKDRFQRVFRSVDLVRRCHETLDWTQY